MVTIRDLSVRYGAKTAADGISFQAEAGQWWMIVGPNGAGKSSLAGALTRSIPYTGEVQLDGREIRSYSGGEFARKVGMLAQNNSNIYGFTVDEVVSLGRYAWRSRYFGGGDPEGEARIREALAATGLAGMRNRSMLSLSGGECQRVFLAQVMAQDPRVMILDEPANHLDLPFQQQLFGMIREWLGKPGRLAITVTHDLGIAKKYGSHALLMSGGKCVAKGEIKNALTPENLERAYGMDIYGWMKALAAEWED